MRAGTEGDVRVRLACNVEDLRLSEYAGVSVGRSAVHHELLALYDFLIDRIETQTLAGLTEHDAIIEAAAQRLRPILMTTLTTILGLMPLMFFGGLFGSGCQW
ncbi:MAG: efflux RND transporter permease subunit [Myxococcales bacterium]|nr:efflux RND transporter permease subunit [Myxococcales bacterium]HIL80908.1 efflux RND transporter permease subunit [Myxococcales bacterium]